MGDVKMNFGRAERARYRKYIVPIYGQFLQKTYCTLSSPFFFTFINFSPCIALEECRRHALAPEEGFEGLESGDLDAEGATFDSCGFAKPVAPAFSSVVPTSVPQDIMDVETSGSAPVQSRSSLAESRPATPHSTSVTCSISSSFSSRDSTALARDVSSSFSSRNSTALAHDVSSSLSPHNSTALAYSESSSAQVNALFASNTCTIREGNRWGG